MMELRSVFCCSLLCPLALMAGASPSSTASDSDIPHLRQQGTAVTESPGATPAPLVCQPLVRPQPPQGRRPHRHRQGPLHSLLDLRRPSPRRLDRRKRLLLLRNRDLSRRQRQDPDTSSTESPLGAQRRLRGSFLRRRTGAGLPRRPSRNVAPHRAVSDQGTRPLQRRLPFRLGGGTLSN